MWVSNTAAGVLISRVRGEAPSECALAGLASASLAETTGSFLSVLGHDRLFERRRALSPYPSFTTPTNGQSRPKTKHSRINRSGNEADIVSAER